MRKLLGGTNEPELLFEQYRLIAEDVSRTREQRDRAIRTYITVNSLILAAFGLLLWESQPNIAGWQALLIVVPLLLAGAVASLQWWWRLKEFEVQVNQRITVLERIERDPGMEFRIHPVFNQIAKRLPERNTGSMASLLRYTYERPILPIVFAIAHIAFAIIVLMVFWTGSSNDSSLESTVSQRCS